MHENENENPNENPTPNLKREPALSSNCRSAQDFVPSVEDGALAGGDADGGFVEEDALALDFAGQRPAAVAHLHFTAQLVGRRAMDPARVGDGKAAALGLFAGSHHDPLPSGIERGYVERERPRQKYTHIKISYDPLRLKKKTKNN